MKCPKCDFEQIEESPSECAKCGILFEKWLERQEVETHPAEPFFDPAPTGDESSPEQYPREQSVPDSLQQYQRRELGAVDPGWLSIVGSTFCHLGLLMASLAIVSFIINLLGFEFILLLPLEFFDNPTRAKLIMIGGGIAMVVVGLMIGGEMPDEDD